VVRLALVSTGRAIVTDTDRTAGSPGPASPPASILAIDVGGTGLKVLATGQSEPRRQRSGPSMTPQEMVGIVKELAADWPYEAVSIGYPGQVGNHGPRSEPGNLGPGWVGFDFAAAFGRPVRIINDAAMQALGSYDGGRMLFLGLGTGLGSTLIAENVIVPLELGQLAYRDGQLLGDVLGRRGLKRLGKKAWRRAVDRVVLALLAAFLADYVVLGGGSAKKIKNPPGGARLSNNLTAFRGGFRLWHLEDVRTHSGEERLPEPAPAAEWRLI
jgi:polyphosphate glucokinase